jgi:hypothetical protein
VAPYDLRRSYAQWLDLARIPQFRQDYYMAHGPKDLNALYKRMREVGAYLAEDAAALSQVVGEQVVLKMVKVGEGKGSGGKVPTPSGVGGGKCNGQRRNRTPDTRIFRASGGYRLRTAESG